MPTIRTGYLGVVIDGTGPGSRLDPSYPWYDATAPDLSPAAILGPPAIEPVGEGSDPNLLEWQESGFPFGSEQSKLTPSDDEVPGILVVQKEVRPESPPGVNPWPVGVLAEWGWAGIPLELGVFPISIGPSAHAGSAGYPGGDFEWHISLLPTCPLITVNRHLRQAYFEVPYTATMAADDGVEPYVWDVLGTLPVGLSLSPEGVLSGTPGALGSFTFILRATDSNGCPGVARCTLVIAARARIEVNGGDRIDDITQADFELGLNQRSTADLLFGDGFIPDRLAEVVLVAQDGVTKIFGGIILTRRVRGEVAGILANATEAHCVDFSVYFDDASVTLSYDAVVAVEDVITAIVDQVLGDYGLTYTPTVTGLTLTSFSWVDVIVTDAFKQISEQTGLVFRTSPDKEILAIVPLAEPAPVSMTDANIHAFDVTATDGTQLAANVVELLCGPSGPGLMRQQWVADGIATAWVTDLPAIDPPPILVEVDDGVTPYLATVVPLGAGGGQFEWDRDTHTLSLGTDPVPAAGTLLTLGSTAHFDSPFTFYTVQFPFKVRVPEGSLPSPPVTYREARPDLVEFGPALAAAYGILARVSVARKDLEIVTDEDGFLPGQALTVNTTARGGIAADFLIASVRGHIVKSNHWEYTLTAQQADVYQGSYVDQWKALTSGGGGAVSEGTVVAPVDRPTGDVVGPAGAVDGEAALFDGTSGKLLKRATGTGVVHRASGVDSVSAVVEADLSLADNTTANVSIAAHGFAPKAPGDATKFLNGDDPPAWTVPGSSIPNVDAATVATSETQASNTAYGDLTTPGPSVTLTLTGTVAIIWLSAEVSHGASGNTAFLGVAVSGASTVAASNANAASVSSAGASFDNTLARVLVLTGLTPGVNTFTPKFANNGGGTWTFFNRTIAVYAP